MITFNVDPIIYPPQGQDYRQTWQYEFTTLTNEGEYTTVKVGGTVEGGATAGVEYSNKVKQTHDGGSEYSNLNIDYSTRGDSPATMASNTSYIGVISVGGVTTSWPMHPDNFSLRRTNNVIETGFDYLNSKNIIGSEYTYKKYLLDILDTVGNNFNYRTYLNTVRANYISEVTEQMNDSVTIEVPNIGYMVGSSVSEPYEVIYTLGFGRPGQIYHISEFNEPDGIRSTVYPLPILIPTQTQFEFNNENEGASYTEFGYSQDMGVYNLIPHVRIGFAPKGQTIERPPGKLLNGTCFVNNGQFFETYSIQINRTFNTLNILSPNLENQLIHYDYEDQYRSIYANSALQEFQDRTLGFTYRSTTSFGNLGSFFCYMAKTINKDDQIRFLRPVKIDKNVIETVVFGNFSEYNREIKVTFFPGIYNITKLPKVYTNNNQSSFQQLRVQPAMRSLDISFPASELFSIEVDNMAFYGGYDVGDGQDLGEGAGDIVVETNNLFEGGSFVSANAPMEYSAYHFFDTAYKYIDDGYEPDLSEIDKYDSFYNSTKWFAQESTALHKLTEKGYIDGIWRCYTQEPYSSIYNTEF